MALTIELVQSGGNYVFTYTPGRATVYRPQYNMSVEPPVLGAVEEEWDIQEATLINSDTGSLITDFGSLLSKLQNRAAPITGVLFKNNGSTVHTMSTSTHTKFRVAEMSQVFTPGGWANHLVLNFKIVALKGIEDASGGDGTANVTQLEQQLLFEYTPEGYLRKTLRGKVRTVGAYAEARARVIGKIELPSEYYRYVTNGPEGVNVVVEDQPAGTQASFECTIQEQALLFPNSTVYKYEVTRNVKRDKRGTITQVQATVQASTLDNAIAAAEDLRPSTGFVSEEIAKDEHTATVRATFTQREPNASGMIVAYERSVQVTGGGEGIGHIQVPGFDPVLYRNPKSVFTVQENITVTALSSPLFALVPPPAYPKNLDASSVQDSVARSSVGVEDGGDEYTRQVSRTYVFGKTRPDRDAMLKFVEADTAILTQGKWDNG